MTPGSIHGNAVCLCGRGVWIGEADPGVVYPLGLAKEFSGFAVVVLSESSRSTCDTLRAPVPNGVGPLRDPTYKGVGKPGGKIVHTLLSALFLPFRLLSLISIMRL